MVFGKLFERSGEDYGEGKRLFELGMSSASQYKCSEALEHYTRSIAACANAAPYINRAKILSNRLRYREALADLLEAQRLDKKGENQFYEAIESELLRAKAIASNYDNGLRNRLIADLAANGEDFVQERIICVSFGIDELQWKFDSFNRSLIEYHFFMILIISLSSMTSRYILKF